MSKKPVVAVLVVGIGEVPQALVNAAEQILGPLPQVASLCFDSTRNPAGLQALLASRATELNEGRGVLILADLCGSTVANLSYQLAEERAGYEVLCGANLAMLMKLYSVDRGAVDPTGLARQLADSGRRGINLASERLLADGLAAGE